MKQDFTSLLDKVDGILHGTQNRDEKLYAVCELLEKEVAHYDWVGFYLVDPEKARELVLGPFVGAPTEHTNIAFGQGICGQAADTEMTFVIQDVTAETNYLSCSPHVKSEIVVPIFKDGVVAGEIDIDSHVIEPFTDDDQVFLEQVAGTVAGIL